MHAQVIFLRHLTMALRDVYIFSKNYIRGNKIVRFMSSTFQEEKSDDECPVFIMRGFLATNFFDCYFTGNKFIKN